MDKSDPESQLDEIEKFLQVFESKTDPHKSIVINVKSLVISILEESKRQVDFTRGFIPILQRLSAAKGEFMKRDEFKSNSQYARMSDLVWWDLIEGNEKGSGEFRITPLGNAFLQGRSNIHKHLIRSQGFTVGYSDKKVFVREIDDLYWTNYNLEKEKLKQHRVPLESFLDQPVTVNG